MDEITKGQNNPPAPIGQGKVLGFAYDKLPPKAAKIARRSAVAIKTIASEEVRVVGTNLIRVKKLLKHGGFAAWLTAELQMDIRTAQRKMAAAKFLKQHPNADKLPMSAIYALAARRAPDSAYDKVIARIDTGEGLRGRDVMDQLRATTKACDAAQRKQKPKPKPKMPRVRLANEVTTTAFKKLIAGEDMLARIKHVNDEILIKKLKVLKRQKD